MKLYTITGIQILIVLLYPVIAFGLLMGNNSLNPWIPLGISLAFCALWRNVRILLISTALMGATAVPIWWIYFERFTVQGQESIAGWYPIIIANFLFYVLIPEIIIVLLRNVALKRFAQHDGDFLSK